MNKRAYEDYFLLFSELKREYWTRDILDLSDGIDLGREGVFGSTAGGVISSRGQTCFLSIWNAVRFGCCRFVLSSKTLSGTQKNMFFMTSKGEMEQFYLQRRIYSGLLLKNYDGVRVGVKAG